jgi:hypothetical protein
MTPLKGKIMIILGYLDVNDGGEKLVAYKMKMKLPQ